MFDLRLYYSLFAQIHVHWFGDAMDMNLSKLWEIVKDGEDWYIFSSWGHRESDTTQCLNNKVQSEFG